MPIAYAADVRFTWDSGKNAANKKRHGVSFEEASELFRPGREYIEIVDETHSDDEDRFIAIGPVRRGLVLVVFTERDQDEVRIVSARIASRREKELYRKFMMGEAQ